MNGGAIDHERLLRAAVLAGNESAWRTLYDSAYENLERCVLWRCGRRRDWADEILQETWLIAVRRIRDFDPTRGNFVQWLTGIAANSQRNHLRKWLTEAKRRENSPEELPEGEKSPVDSERIAAALAAMPERQERVLREKYLEGKSMEAIAAEWGESIKAVESLLTRARAAFRAIYEPEENHAGIR